MLCLRPYSMNERGFILDGSQGVMATDPVFGFMLPFSSYLLDPNQEA